MDTDAYAPLIRGQEENRRQFLALVEELRPELHRYGARMTGSVADGEDVVQDTLARAYFQLPELQELPPLRPWLFRIAHNLAIDHYRRTSYRVSEPLEAAMDLADDHEHEPENTTARAQAVKAALSSFLALTPAQRGCVILKDVLGHSLEEIAALLEISVPATKAALHRGRLALRQSVQIAPHGSAPHMASPQLQLYARLFNARDWDGVRDMLATDVRLDLVSRLKLVGGEVTQYFGNYARLNDWRLAPAWLDGREVLAVTRAEMQERPSYFIELGWDGDRVCLIRDYRHLPYVMFDALIDLASLT